MQVLHDLGTVQPSCWYPQHRVVTQVVTQVENVQVAGCCFPFFVSLGPEEAQAVTGHRLLEQLLWRRAMLHEQNLLQLES